VAGPGFADCSIGRDDKWQRQQQQEQRAACVEEDRGCQSALDPVCERAGGLGGPSPGVLGTMSDRELVIDRKRWCFSRGSDPSVGGSS
jgi:hypothetical protein